VCRCRYCMLTYCPLGICPRVVKQDHMADLFFMRKLHTDFHSGRANLRSHPQYIRVLPCPLHLPSICLFSCRLIAVLIGVRWDRSAILICTSFMTKDAKLFLMCFWLFALRLLKTVQFICTFIKWIIYSFGV
jgi:hypothetical protein